MPAPCFHLSSSSSAINPLLFVTFSLAIIYPTNMARDSPVTARLHIALKTCSMYQDASQSILLLMRLMNVPKRLGFRHSREKVIALMKMLVKLNHPNLRLCITSRPEIDIRISLEPLTSNRISVHEQSGQKQDIVDFISSVVYLDENMPRWREEDKKIVIETLSERADGM